MSSTLSTVADVIAEFGAGVNQVLDQLGPAPDPPTAFRMVARGVVVRSLKRTNPLSPIIAADVAMVEGHGLVARWRTAAASLTAVFRLMRASTIDRARTAGSGWRTGRSHTTATPETSI